MASQPPAQANLPGRVLRASARTAANTPDDEEAFNFDNISGSGEDDDQPVPRARTQTRNTVPQIVNNPDPTPPKLSTAADVKHFFEMIGDKRVCTECKYV